MVLVAKTNIIIAKESDYQMALVKHFKKKIFGSSVYFIKNVTFLNTYRLDEVRTAGRPNQIS